MKVEKHLMVVVNVGFRRKMEVVIGCYWEVEGCEDVVMEMKLEEKGCNRVVWKLRWWFWETMEGGDKWCKECYGVEVLWLLYEFLEMKMNVGWKNFRVERGKKGREKKEMWKNEIGIRMDLSSNVKG